MRVETIPTYLIRLPGKMPRLAAFVAGPTFVQTLLPFKRTCSHGITCYGTRDTQRQEKLCSSRFTSLSFLPTVTYSICIVDQHLVSRDNQRQGQFILDVCILRSCVCMMSDRVSHIAKATQTHAFTTSRGVRVGSAASLISHQPDRREIGG